MRLNPNPSPRPSQPSILHLRRKIATTIVSIVVHSAFIGPT